MPSTSYAPSEAAIEAAIQRRIGSPGFFQRVAEQVARGVYVELAASLVPLGRRPDDKTVSGWPDAYLSKAAGTIIAIEATTAGDARVHHWPADLTKMKTRLAPERRGGLIWVAWCDPLLPTDAVEMRDQACQLGLPAEDTHIIFRKELCARLRAPYHAGFWINDLDLGTIFGPFSGIKDVIRRVSMRRSAGIFPTAEEYDHGRVYPPQVLAAVEKTLVEHHAAMVVGRGATGKTTLAMVLSHRPRYRHAPTYYLDLTATAADPTLSERAGEALAAVADRGVLFIIDNAHLNPEAAVRAFEQWQAFGRGSDLLILSRRIKSRPEAWKTEPELDLIGVPYLDLAVEPGDLEGVYRRHYRARIGNDPAPVQPDVLRRWQWLFGGDLMAFSVAVLGLLDRAGDTAALTPADAGAYVRRHYLNDPELIAEQSALLDLAAVAEIEALLPVEAFADDALKESVRRGLVWVETIGFNNHNAWEHYRLAHPGLGTLLRDAAGVGATSRDDRCRVLQIHPFACIAAASMLGKTGEGAEAGALLAALWRNAEWPSASNGLHWWGGALSLTQELDVLNAKEISALVAAWLSQPGARAALLKQVLATPLHFDRLFLAYAQREIPAIFNTLSEDIASRENWAALIERAFATPLSDLVSFLAYARTEMPEAAKAIHAGLAKNQAMLMERALATPLSDLVSFLAYARTEMPEAAKAIHAGLAKNQAMLMERALATPLGQLASFLVYGAKELPKVAKDIRDEFAKNHATLVERALASPLGQLASFLVYAIKELPQAAEAIHNELAKNHAILVERALATPLDQLASFFAYARTEMPEVATALRRAIVSEPLLPILASRFIHYGPEKIVALSKQDEAFMDILPAINAEAWSRHWMNTNHGQPSWFRGFASLFYRANRSDLVGITAQAIIRTAHDADFPSPSITILHLTYILTSSHGCTPREVANFFERCLSRGWVAAAYRSPDATTAALAGAVRSVALDERVWLARHFRDPALRLRLDAERPTNGHSPRQIAEWLQLFCAARLLDRWTTYAPSVSSLQLSAALKVAPAGPPNWGIQPIQASLWAGLREWCHLTREQPIIDSTLAQGILAQFRAANPVGRPRLAALNAVMIEWLERCRGQGWRLVADNISLLDALESKLRNGPTAVM